LRLSAASTADDSAVTSEASTSLVHAFISCRLDYCNALLYGIADCQLQRLRSVQNAAARLVTGLQRIMPTLKSPHWLPTRQRVTYMYKLATLVHKCLNDRTPLHLALAELSSRRRSTYGTGMRSVDSAKFHVPPLHADFI